MTMRSLKTVLALVVMLILIVAGAVFAEESPASPADPKTVDVERLVIRDSEGRVRIELTVLDDEPVIRLYTAHGAIIFELHAWEETFAIRKWGYFGNDSLVDVLKSYDDIAMRWELGLVRMIAVMNTDAYGLTDRLIKKSFNADIIQSTAEKPSNIMAMVDTLTQPIWNVYRGNGRFSVSDRELRATYQEAGTVVCKDICGFFPVSMDRVTIQFSINGAYVGVWRDGVMKLAGE